MQKLQQDCRAVRSGTPGGDDQENLQFPFGKRFVRLEKRRPETGRFIFRYFVKNFINGSLDGYRNKSINRRQS